MTVDIDPCTNQTDFRDSTRNLNTCCVAHDHLKILFYGYF